MPSEPFYLSKAWKETRKVKLAASPRCEHPGCGARASVVDHVLARRAGGAPYDQRNLASMCWSHHSAKTVRQDGGFGRAPGLAPVICGADVHGMPLDPKHRWNVQRAAAAAATGAV